MVSSQINVHGNLCRFWLKSAPTEKYRNHKSKMLKRMKALLNSPCCRRQIILKHFETDERDPANCSKVRFETRNGNCCDNCAKQLHELRQSQAKKVLAGF